MYMYIHLCVFVGILGTFGRVAPSNPGELFQHFHAALVFLCASVSYIYIKSSYIFSLSLWATNMHEVHRSSMHTSGHPALSLPPEVCTISFSATCPPEKKGTELKVDVHEIRAIQPCLHMYPESPLPSTVYTHI